MASLNSKSLLLTDFYPKLCSFIYKSFWIPKIYKTLSCKNTFSIDSANESYPACNFKNYNFIYLYDFVFVYFNIIYMLLFYTCTILFSITDTKQSATKLSYVLYKISTRIRGHLFTSTTSRRKMYLEAIKFCLHAAIILDVIIVKHFVLHTQPWKFHHLSSLDSGAATQQGLSLSYLGSGGILSGPTSLSLWGTASICNNSLKLVSLSLSYNHLSQVKRYPCGLC